MPNNPKIGLPGFRLFTTFYYNIPPVGDSIYTLLQPEDFFQWLALREEKRRKQVEIKIFKAGFFGKLFPP